MRSLALGAGVVKLVNTRDLKSNYFCEIMENRLYFNKLRILTSLYIHCTFCTVLAMIQAFIKCQPEPFGVELQNVQNCIMCFECRRGGMEYTGDLIEIECPGGNIGSRTAQIRGNLSGSADGNPERSTER